ncbi:type VI secretion system protein TssA [Proteus sp. TJ1640]|uniref:type VI secretion system protein TssA n=1 Tax=Proteus sp. TJ1640 TaxID=2050968 RepID=UPI000D68C215|nr:type VI secretion system protein TssA [Proteus sp. TJ1640]
MTIGSLLTPISPENPCGDNLEYDAEFMKLEQFTEGKTEQQFGDTIIPAELPDWAAVERIASNLLSRTKDLRVMSYLTLAWTQLRGLQGYLDGLQLIYSAIEQYWPQLYPLLDEEGENDPIYRINALALLGDNSPLTYAVRSAPFIKGSNSELSLRDACSLLDGSKQELEHFPDGLPRLRSELGNPLQENVQLIAPITDSLAKLRHAIVLLLDESALPEMALLLDGFDVLSQAIVQANSITDVDSEPECILDPLATPLSDDAISLTPIEFGYGKVQSRADAMHLLEKVKEYFVQYEPSHPAPLMIDRLQKLINLNFMQIMQDLAPDSLRQLETILGTQETEKK